MPSLDRLWVALKDRGFSLLLVNLGERAAHVRRVVAERGYRAPVLLDEDQAVSGRYAVNATPIVYLLDRDLQIAGRAIGRRDWTGPDGLGLLEALLGPPRTGR